MYAQAVRTPPQPRHRGGRRILSSASEQCAKGCAFPDVQLDCIKYLKLGEKTLPTLIQTYDTTKKTQKTQILLAA